MKNVYETICYVCVSAWIGKPYSWIWQKIITFLFLLQTMAYAWLVRCQPITSPLWRTTVWQTSVRSLCCCKVSPFRRPAVTHLSVRFVLIYFLHKLPSIQPPPPEWITLYWLICVSWLVSATLIILIVALILFFFKTLIACFHYF